jgi:hypothetical protein
MRIYNMMDRLNAMACGLSTLSSAAAALLPALASRSSWTTRFSPVVGAISMAYWLFAQRLGETERVVGRPRQKGKLLMLNAELANRLGPVTGGTRLAASNKPKPLFW